MHTTITPNINLNLVPTSLEFYLPLSVFINEFESFVFSKTAPAIIACYYPVLQA